MNERTSVEASASLRLPSLDDSLLIRSEWRLLKQVTHCVSYFIALCGMHKQTSVLDRTQYN